MDTNRGAAYWNGKVIVGTSDAGLIALDAKTGEVDRSVNTVPADIKVNGKPRHLRGAALWERAAPAISPHKSPTFTQWQRLRYSLGDTPNRALKAVVK